jgi:hypothetical protein
VDGSEPGTVPHVRDAADRSLSMSGYQSEAKTPREVEIRARNRKTGLILASIALVFFLGVVLQHAFVH